MKRKTKTIILVIIALIVLVPIIVILFGDLAVETGVEKGASKVLNVDVNVDDVSLSVLSGKVELEDIIVSNPEGYDYPNLLEAEEVDIEVGLSSLMSDTVKIENMIFNDITIFIEQKGLTTNLQEVLNSIPKSEPEKEKLKKGKKLLIENLEMTDISVKVNILPVPGKADTFSLDLAPIKMTDVGTEDKTSIAVLTAKILGAIAESIAEQGTGVIPGDVIGSINDALKSGSSMIFQRGKEVIESGKEVLEKGTETGKEITEEIEGLFNDKNKNKKD